MNGNVTNDVKEIIWDYISLLYVFSELYSKEKDKMDKELIKELLHSVNVNSKRTTESTSTSDNSPNKQQIKEKPKTNKKSKQETDSQNILNLDCNKETNNMIMIL